MNLSVYAPVAAVCAETLRPDYALTVPLNVVFAIIFLLEYINVVPRDVDYTRLHLIFFKICIVANLYVIF